VSHQKCSRQAENWTSFCPWTEACPRGDAATSALLATMLGSLPPQVGREPRARGALAAVAACRVLATRGVPTAPAAVAAAAAADNADATTTLVHRVTAKAVREGTSSAAARTRSFDGGAWSRALWTDLASLAAPHGALAPHFSREARGY